MGNMCQIKEKFKIILSSKALLYSLSILILPQFHKTAMIIISIFLDMKAKLPRHN